MYHRNEKSYLADIIEIGSYKYATVDLDLNLLRKFQKVKKVDDKYLQDEGTHFELFLRSEVTFDEEEIEKVNTAEIKKDKEMYQNWYYKEQSKVSKLEEELKCLKLDLEKMKKGE